jgi:hypothetical protein
MPPSWSATARDRSVGGSQRANSAITAGNVAASATPIAMRTAMRNGIPANAAVGVSSVASDHAASATPSTSRPPNRAISQPPGSIASR